MNIPKALEKYYKSITDAFGRNNFSVGDRDGSYVCMKPQVALGNVISTVVIHGLPIDLRKASLDESAVLFYDNFVPKGDDKLLREVTVNIGDSDVLYHQGRKETIIRPGHAEFTFRPEELRGFGSDAEKSRLMDDYSKRWYKVDKEGLIYIARALKR